MRVLTFLALFFPALGGLLPAAPGRPNVILCMADDLGWGDTGFNGHPHIKTPHLDAMAQSGVTLTRYYAGAPVCSPTRGSCLTGRNPFRYGIPNANAGHLKAEEVNLAEVLKAQGYATGHFGKWHLGTLSPDWSGKGAGRNPKANHMTPGMAGFGEWFSTEFSIATYDPYDPENGHCAAARAGDRRALFWHNGKPLEEPLHGCTSRMVMDRAIPFIDAAVREKKPFFAVIWFHAPHLPVVGHPEFIEAHYRERPEDEQHYFSSITALDAQMGRLRQALRDLGVAQDTLLCFASDNGPEGNPGPKGRSQGSSGKFRGRKRSLYEGGVRVPSVIEWPGHLEAQSLDVPCVSSDYFPTICSLVGAPLPARPYDGIDLMPILTGEQRKRDATIGFRFGRDCSLVSDKFKLVHNGGDLKRRRSDNGSEEVAEFELYNIRLDPFETNNIISEFPAVAAAMKGELARFVASTEASAEGADYR